MNQDANGIYVARSDHCAFIRIEGRGTHQNAGTLRQFGQEAMKQGCAALYLDLEHCANMDSTFLGVLAGFGLRLRELGRPAPFHLFNAGNRAAECCQLLGLDRLAQIEAGPLNLQDVQQPAPEHFQKLPGSDLTSRASAVNRNGAARMMLEAHEDLCRCDERNEAKFKDVKEFLRKDLETG